MKILHITKKDTWAKAQQEGIYQADTLKSDGYIHCCQPDQLKGVLEKWFDGAEDLISLELDTDKVEAKIVYENLEEGEALFPHIYGPINLDAITRIITL